MAHKLIIFGKKLTKKAKTPQNSKLGYLVASKLTSYCVYAYYVYECVYVCSCCLTINRH